MISAIGHQIDTTIIDYVSDLAAPTPSAAAEMIIEKKANLNESLNSLQQRLVYSLSSNLELWKSKMNGLRTSVVFKEPMSFVNQQSQRLDILQDNLVTRFQTGFDKHRQRLELCNTALRGLDPHRVLDRGYSITRRKSDGKAISNAFAVGQNEEIITLFKDTTLESVVKKSDNIKEKQEG